MLMIIFSNHGQTSRFVWLNTTYILLKEGGRCKMAGKFLLTKIIEVVEEYRISEPI